MNIPAFLIGALIAVIFFAIKHLVLRTLMRKSLILRTLENAKDWLPAKEIAKRAGISSPIYVELALLSDKMKVVSVKESKAPGKGRRPRNVYRTYEGFHEDMNTGRFNPDVKGFPV